MIPPGPTHALSVSDFIDASRPAAGTEPTTIPTSDAFHAKQNAMSMDDISQLARDPTIAVALAADALGRLRPGQSLIFQTNTLEDAYGSKSESRTTACGDADTDVRILLPTPDALRSMLDALAYITSAISSPASTSCTVACAVRLPSSTDTVELILAGSSEISVTGCIVRTVYAIWEAMQKLSEAAERRHGETDGEGKKVWVQRLLSLRLTLYASALRPLFTVNKEDSMGIFEEGMEIIEAWRTVHSLPCGRGTGGERRLQFSFGLEQPLNSVRGELVNALYYLDRLRGAVIAARVRMRVRRDAALREGLHFGSLQNGWEKESEDLATLVGSLELLRDAVERLIQLHTPALKILSNVFFGAEHTLMQAFLNVTALPRHVMSMLQFAANCMDGYSSHKLILQLVAPLAVTSRTKRHPRKYKDVWSELGSYVLEKSGVTGTQCGQPRPICARVHPELTLATYLHAVHYAQSLSSLAYCRGDPPHDYLGTAHPPCTPCALWLGEYNARSERQASSCSKQVGRMCLEFREGSGEGIGIWHGRQEPAWGWVLLPSFPGQALSEADLGEPSDFETRLVCRAWDVYARATASEDGRVQTIADGQLKAGL